MPISQSLAVFRTLAASTIITLSACGGGGGSSDPSPTGTPGTPHPDSSASPQPNGSPAPSIAALNESRCAAINEYEWLEERCYVIGNPNVENLQYIELLPAQDRQDLLDWLTKLEKKVGFNKIFPNFSDDSSLGSIPNADDVLALDHHLLLQRLNNSSVLKTNSGMVSISKLGLSDESYTQEISVNASVDESVIEDKRVGLNLGGGRMILSLFGAEVYRFNMVDELFLQSHISNNRTRDLSSKPTLKLKSKRQDEQSHASMPTAPLLELLSLHFAAEDDSVSAVQQHLTLSQDYADNHITLDAKQPKLAMQLQLADESSALFSNSEFDSNITGLSATAENLYFPKFSLGTHLHKDVVNLPLQIYLSPARFSGSKGSVITVALELQLEEAEALNDEITQRTYSYKKPKFVQNTDAKLYAFDETPPAFDLNTGFTQRLEAMQNSADRSLYSSDQWPYFPSYRQWVSSFATLVESEHQLAMTLLMDESLRQKVMTLAAPKYAAGTAMPTQEEWNDSRFWADDLSRILNQAFEEDAEQALEKLPTWLSSEQNIPAFAELNQHLGAVLEPLDDELLSANTEYLLDFYVRMAYLGQLSSSQMPTPEQMLNAINTAGIDFQSAMQGQLLNLTNVSYNAPRQWNIDQDALGIITAISSILNDTNVALIKDHDNKAFDYSSINKLNTQVFTLYIDSNKDLSVLTQALQQRHTALSELNQFVELDAVNMQDDFKFKAGANDLAGRAYKERWSAQTYHDLVKVMSFAYTRNFQYEPQCTSSSVVENIYCTDRFDPKLFKLYSNTEGYLAKYGESKPYIEQAEVLVNIDSSIAQIDELKGSLIQSLRPDYTRAIEDGLWLDCDAEQIVNNSNNAKHLIDRYLQLVQADPLPTLYSDAFEAQQETKEAFISQLKQCEQVDSGD
ncbi:hypothetical protein [Agaribacterium sp. ZY112]|uniref:hypothetical protein n=1 Tax=Agaribacterium sp. ZY112 TaxID=3233574 RepID=UPI003523B6DD